MLWPTCLLVSLPLIAQLVTLFKDQISRTRNSDGCLVRFLMFWPMMIHWKNLLKSFWSGFSRFIRCSIVSWFRDARSGAGGEPRAPATHAHRLCHWPCLLHLLLRGRGQVALCGLCLAKVRSRFLASAWPTSGRGLRGFCMAEFIWCSLGSALPRSCPRRWLLELLVCCGPTASRPGCCARLRSEWCLFFFCSPVQFSFFSCPLRKWHPCRLGAWLISVLQP